MRDGGATHTRLLTRSLSTPPSTRWYTLRSRSRERKGKEDAADARPLNTHIRSLSECQVEGKKAVMTGDASNLPSSLFPLPITSTWLTLSRGSTEYIYPRPLGDCRTHKVPVLSGACCFFLIFPESRQYYALSSVLGARLLYR